MWLLCGNESKPGEIHYLPCGTTLYVSRKDGHILLRGDTSISRQHAFITVSHSADDIKDPDKLPKIAVRDLKSKYGTFVNDGITQDVKISSEEERPLCNGDKVRFGMISNTWILKYEPLVVTTSTLHQDSKKDLQNALIKLGGHLISDWSSSCSYLVMDNVTLTVKAVCALAASKPIVTPAFFNDLVDAILKKSDHPVATRYLPQLQEMSLNKNVVDFSPNEVRKNLFSGKIFVFPLPKQLKRMKQAVKLAGGEFSLLEDKNASLVSLPNYRLVQLPKDTNLCPERTKLYASAKQLLRERGLRVIPESEIGLAIVYIDAETNCNPEYVVSSILRRNGSSMTQTQSLQILATETQNTEDHVIPNLSGTRVVPESGTTSSRRTPATLPGTSFPMPSNPGSSMTQSGSSITSTSTNMTSASTNMSMPPPVLLCKTDTGSELNGSQRSSKRLRSASKESTEPPSKRANGTSSRSSHQELEPTQPMEGEIEEEDLSQACPERSSQFKPKEFSTPAFNRINETDKSKADTTCDGSSRGNETTILFNGNPSLEPTVGRSIPFEPYTLPSLNADVYRQEEEEEAVPYIKEEPASLPSDELDRHVANEPDQQVANEPDRQVAKRRREEPEISDGEPDDWISKKRTSNDIRVKRERKGSKDDDRTAPVMNIKKEVVPVNNDMFSLKFNERTQRTADIKKRRMSPEDADDDPFNLPKSSRAEMHRKAMKVENVAKDLTRSNNTIPTEEKVAAVAQHYQQIANTSNANRSKTTCNSSTAEWISKNCTKEAVSPAVVKKAEYSFGDVTGKNEPRHGDVAELAGSLEKSLVVVEVASLVRRKQKPPPEIISHNISNGNLKNFKKFRKSSSSIVSLPKIIGGQDMVPHDVAEAASRDEWFQENPDVTTLFEDRDAAEHAQEAELNAMFDLPTTTRGRTYKRR